MLVCNYFFSLFFSDSFFMGLVVGLMGRFSGALGVLVGVALFTSGLFCLHRGCFVYIGAVLFTSGRFCLHRGGFVYIGAVLFTSGWFCLHRGGFVYIGVVLFSSGRQNGDMWHRYGAVLQQIAVMKQ